MSYNNYASYSPYFPSQPANPNDRSQYSYQNASGGTSDNPPHGEYQRQTYVPPNPALSSQQSQTHQNSNGTYADTMRYTNLEGTASTSHQNQRNDYSYSNARPSGDTTALGNLAYASTLRQTSGSGQQPADYSRPGQHGGYDQGRSQVDEHGIQRSDSRDSRGSGNMNLPYTSALSNSTYPATSGQQNQELSTYGGNYRSYQPTYQHAQPARPETSDVRRVSQHTAPTPPSRPASGQSTHVSRPHFNQQSKQTSRTAVHTPIQQTSLSRPTQAVNWNSHQPSTSSDEAQLSRQLNAQQTRPGAVTTAPPNRTSVSSAASHIRAPSNASVNERPASRPQSAQNVPNTQSKTHTNAVRHQHPTTVDPNQVFNHYEYEKRQAEAEASKRKAAAEAEEAKRRAEAARQQQTARPNAPASGVSNGHIDEETRKKEQMETEMKLMLEKMREYKSKDPTLFSQIWESVKKAQPPGVKDTTQASELPASKEVALPSPQAVPSDLQSPQPSTPAVPPSASETVQQPQNEDLPDRGKFPAARRKRYEKKLRGGRVSAVDGQVDEEEVSAAHGQDGEQATVVHGHEATTAPISAVPIPDVQASAASSASGQTMWPEADKWNLANAARDTLLAIPQNAGKLITNTEIHNILNQGPSYEELCSILQAKGFVVDRTPFAQSLLAAVPKLKDGHPRQSVQASTLHPPLSQPLQRNGSSGNVAPTAPMFGVLQPAVRFAPIQASQVPHQTPKSSPVFQQPVRPSPPPSKQAQARKRTFGEIVDLTAEMSSDEELKRRRAEELKKIEEIKHMQQVKAAMEAAMNAKANATPRLKTVRLSPGTGLSASEDDAVSRLSQFKNPTPQREHLRRSKEVIRPMNARADALRRSTYDPKSIARDILVASGKHPTMASLNYHLDCLRSSFRHVDASSDLSTFNWDLIDPGGPPVKPRAIETPLAQQNENEDADDEEVDVTKSGHSQLANTNRDDASPSGPMKGFFQPGRGRGRKHGPQSSLDRPPRQRQPDQNNPQAQTPHNSADVSMLGPGAIIPGAFEPRVLPSTPTQTSTSIIPARVQLSTGESGKKRRGRPPKSRILESSSETSPQHSRPANPEVAFVDKASGHTVPAGTPQTLKSPRIIGSANPQRPNTSTTPARPSGLRNQIDASPFAVVIQRSPNNVGSAPNHEQVKKIKKVRVSPAPPKYQIYKCRWKDCEGRLHNLETLRKHVLGHMSQFDEKFECLWEGCGMTDVAGTSGSQPLTFKSETAWERHMDGRHLDRYAWDLGDGPSPHPSGESI